MSMEPKRGLVFEHTRWLDEDYKPLLMRVTRIANGTVYYRALDGSCPTCCELSTFNTYARPAKELTEK